MKDVLIGDNSSQVGPKFNLEIAHFLDRFLHFSEESFKLYHIG